jgi:uncharacterized protein
VTAAFLSASAIFGGAALYGAITKRSLISIGGVLLFTGFTAYDVQRIQTGALVAMTGSVEKAAVIGALRLYLDFVNLFLFLLRRLGGRR